ncbi:YjbH domain-containing protein [Limnohabitans sp.]
MVLALASVACQALDIALMKYFLWPWIGALALVSPLHAIAEEATTLTPSSAIKLTPPSGARLGAWLTQNHSDLAAGMYAPGTMWLDIAEAENQAREKAALLIDISAATHIRVAHFVMMQQGVPVSSRRLERAAWANARYAWRGQAASHQSGPVATEWGPTQYAKVQKPSGNVGLGYQQHVGGPDGYLYSLNATAQGQWPLWTGAWAQATAKARLIDNYDKYRYTAPSNLPRVRTYVREYLSSERITLPNMQVNQLKPWGDGLYSLVYAGALESMFAGVGAEVMWRPLDSQWALGADMNRLAQRDFDQRLSLRDYRVNSGHITAYWDTRWQGVEAKLMVGQYLAGDRGATVEIARRFNNGARMGAWVTKTNVSSSAFGEGSFDKGVFVSIPFDAFLTAWSTQSVNVAWQPLIRDGGARLNKAQTLWNLTNSRDEREWSSEPARFSK